MSKRLYLFITVCILALSSCGEEIATRVFECGLLAEESEWVPTDASILASIHATVKFGLCTCEKMKGTLMRYREENAWTDSWNRRVAGLANCNPPNVELGQGIGHQAYTTALIHELVHIQECPWMNTDHEGWKENGTYDVITKARYAAEEEVFPKDAGP